MSRVHIFIPARYQSTRFPGKPLHKINGRSLIVHTAVAVMKALPHELVRDAKGRAITVLTDDERIYNEAHRHGFHAMFTPADCANGTERCAWAAQRMCLQANDIVVNWQGDAPLTPPEALAGIYQTMTRDVVSHGVVTAGYKDTHSHDISLVSIATRPVEYTSGLVSEAMYFSRQELATPDSVTRHIGIYGYRVHALDAYANLMRERPHEHHEQLEQLRWLEHGFPVAVVNIPRPSKRVVELNTPADAEVLKELLP